MTIWATMTFRQYRSAVGAPEALNVALQQVLAAFILEALVLARKPLDDLPYAVAEGQGVALHAARQVLAAAQ